MYTTSTKLKALAKNKHNIELEFGNCKKTKCAYPGCKELFYHKSKMIDHLNKFHQVEAQKQVIKFENEKFFYGLERKRGAKKLCILSKATWKWKIKITYSKIFYLPEQWGMKTSSVRWGPYSEKQRKNRRGQIKTGR